MLFVIQKIGFWAIQARVRCILASILGIMEEFDTILQKNANSTELRVNTFMMHNTPLDAIGNTPLVRVPFDSPATFYAKLEYLNPSGSMKDRSALFLVTQAEQQGLLKPGYTLIDASSGNHGIALAMIGAIKGYSVIITVSEKISREKLDAIQAYGAQVVMCPSTAVIEDPHSYHSVAKKIREETPNSYMVNQYFNPLNATAHYSSLGPEIIKQTSGTITHFFSGAGTGGTLSGVGKYLKEYDPAIKVIGIDAANSYRATQGNPQPYAVEGIGIDFISPVMDYSVVDAIETVSDAEAFSMLPILAQKMGVLAGPSSGAVAYAVQKQAKKFAPNDVIVMIFGDSGRAYLTKNFYTVRGARMVCSSI
jgi:cystathionine beta-synthase